MASENTITNFFGSDYIAFAAYDVTRKISSYIDGLKPTARKIVYTTLDLNIVKPEKVDLIKAKVAGHTEYLHGQDSIEGVIVNLAQNFAGACNIPLLTREGSFGFRLIPNAAASRYIKTYQESYLKLIFSPEDNAIIGNQEFEGSRIEPKYYVPIIPMLLINGSEGISVGHAQKILPRDPVKLMKYIFEGMKDSDLLLPYYKGFCGEIVKTDDKSFAIYGRIDCKNSTTYEITEVPIGYTYSSYMKVLNKLSETDLIQSFEDLCDMDKDVFKFIIKVKRETHNRLQLLSKEELLDEFKLIKRVTENYTCLNENNQIEVFTCVEDIIKKYVNIRIQTYNERKKHIESQMLKNIFELKSKIIFINAVRNKILDIKNESKASIVSKLKELDGIIMKNDSFDYLLNMPIFSISSEAQDKLIAEVKKLAEEYKKYCEIKISTIWRNEYSLLCKQLN